MAVAAKMPETPEELRGFIQGVVDRQVVELQRETLEELRRLGERQAKVEGRVEELGQAVRLYREDFQGLREDFRSLLERFDHFQVEMRREHEVFRQEMRAENEKFRQETRAENEKFRQETRAENEKFRQEMGAENEKFRQEVWRRFERIDGRLFEMQKSLTVQTRWLVALLVAAPVIYSVMERVLARLLP
jgi:Asp-tRNA(Asn)/Glu-tRNA(Gln) amidotransferase A subunit family amidase